MSNADAAPATTQASLLTVQAIAALMACSPRTVHRLVDARRIPPPVRLGRMVRWPREPFEQWIASGCPLPENTKSPAKRAKANS